MSESDVQADDAALDDENSLEEGINEPEEPKAKKVPPECKECPGGAPPWMATFADMATLLMAFFVLILSFANVNVPKFEQVSGSLKVAFGVARVIPKIKLPMGETLLKTEFTPADAEPTVIPDKSQKVQDPNHQFVKQMTEENQEDFDTPEELLEVKELLQEELEKGQVRVRMQGEEILVELLSPEQQARSGAKGQSLSGQVPQEHLEIAKKITDI